MDFKKSFKISYLQQIDYKILGNAKVYMNLEKCKKTYKFKQFIGINKNQQLKDLVQKLESIVTDAVCFGTGWLATLT